MASMGHRGLPPSVKRGQHSVHRKSLPSDFGAGAPSRRGSPCGSNPTKRMPPRPRARRTRRRGGTSRETGTGPAPTPHPSTPFGLRRDRPRRTSSPAPRYTSRCGWTIPAHGLQLGRSVGFRPGPLPWSAYRVPFSTAHGSRFGIPNPAKLHTCPRGPRGRARRPRRQTSSPCPHPCPSPVPMDSPAPMDSPVPTHAHP